MTKFLVTNWDKLGTELCEAMGIDETYVRRLVLDLEVGSPGRIYFETFADNQVLNVSLGTVGIEIEKEKNGG